MGAEALSLHLKTLPLNHVLSHWNAVHNRKRSLTISSILPSQFCKQLLPVFSVEEQQEDSTAN